MVRSLLAILLLALPIVPQAKGSCDYQEALLGCFDAGIDDDGVTLKGESGAPGGQGGGSGDEGPDGERCDAVWHGECIAWISPPPADAGATMNDVAHLAPSVASHLMEPDGWAVLGLPANVYSATTTEVRSGTVLGTPAEVRFTPVGWQWDYGDGESRFASTGGASWAALRLGEFEPTSTSHVYRVRGDYVITLAVEFSAEYRIGAGPWQRIPGTLTRDAPVRTVLVRTVRTVLVDDDCLVDPRGVGC